MIIAVLFISTNLKTALDSPTHYPFMTFFVQATDSVSGATVMASIITVMQFGKRYYSRFTFPNDMVIRSRPRFSTLKIYFKGAFLPKFTSGLVCSDSVEVDYAHYFN